MNGQDLPIQKAGTVRLNITASRLQVKGWRKMHQQTVTVRGFSRFDKRCESSDSGNTHTHHKETSEYQNQRQDLNSNQREIKITYKGNFMNSRLLNSNNRRQLTKEYHQKH